MRLRLRERRAVLGTFLCTRSYTLYKKESGILSHKSKYNRAALGAGFPVWLTSPAWIDGYTAVSMTFVDSKLSYPVRDR